LALEDFSSQTRQWRLPPGTALFVTAEPCLMCTGALLWARATQIFYGCDDPKQAGLRKIEPLIHAGTFDHRFEKIEGGLFATEAAQLLKEFFQKKRLSKKEGTSGTPTEI
jgi:tRNA(adenine34) deaminase